MNRRTAIRSLLGSSLVAAGHSLGAARGVIAPSAIRWRRAARISPAKAKRVIFLHMSGGVSHVDSFDYKPRLIADHNRRYQVPKKMLDAFAPDNRSEVKYFKRPGGSSSSAASRDFGSANFFRRSPSAPTTCASSARCTATTRITRRRRSASIPARSRSRGPSMGSWVSYGLGSENQNLPGVHGDRAGAALRWRASCGRADFLPGCHQGTHVVPGPDPVPNIQRRLADPDLQEMELGMAAGVQSAAPRAAATHDPQLDPRIRSFETAFGMQAAAPEAFDLAQRDRRPRTSFTGLRAAAPKASPGSA